MLSEAQRLALCAFCFSVTPAAVCFRIVPFALKNSERGGSASELRFLR